MICSVLPFRFPVRKDEKGEFDIITSIPSGLVILCVLSGRKLLINLVFVHELHSVLLFVTSTCKVYLWLAGAYCWAWSDAMSLFLTLSIVKNWKRKSLFNIVKRMGMNAVPKNSNVIPKSSTCLETYLD